LLASVISLLVVPKKRKAGWVLLAFLVGMPLILIPVAGFFLVSGDRVIHNELMRQRPPLPRTATRLPIIESDPQSIPTKPPALPPVQPAAEIPANAPANPTAPTQEKQPLDKALTAESARLIDAFSKVLAKTILEDPKTWQDFAAKAGEQTAPPAEKTEPSAEKQTEKKSAEQPPPAAAPIEPATPKPAWVGQGWHDLDNKGRIFERDALVDTVLTPLESEKNLPETVQKAIDEFVEIYFLDSNVRVKLPPDTLRSFVKDRYEEWRVTTQGKTLSLHARVKIDKDDIEKAYRKAQAAYAEAERRDITERRLWSFGTCFSGGFLFLAAVWGYLKTDLATGGNRRGVLRTAVLVVILSIAAAVAVVMMV
jgi:hypothetical protein